MIPIVREFFRGLRERDELDVIIPEMLTGMGFEVISRPMTGTRQYGADVAAIGVDTDGVRKLFLFSIKRGDLTRVEWNGPSNQALRPSLEEIKDAYLRGLAPEHSGLPVIVCITMGGIIPENVQPLVNGFMNDSERPGLTFRVWSGDTLTGKVMDGALREEVFPADLRSLLRKAAAMVDEPDVASTYFNRLVEQVLSDGSQEPLSRLRVSYLALWILFVWAREANNLEAPYRASELLILRSWELLWRDIDAGGAAGQKAGHAVFEAVQLHLRIWDELYRAKVLPHAGSLHALSFATGSRTATDINLSLFETMGRVAMGGLWRLWLNSAPSEPPRILQKMPADVEAIARTLAAVPFTNPALMTPLTEDQGIDISLSLLLLGSAPATRQAARSWIRQMSHAIMIAYATHHRYPTIKTDYATLLAHPVQTDEYRKEATAGSIIQPLLAMFAAAEGDAELVRELSVFQADRLKHSTYQTWVPNERTEDRIWHGERQGSSLGSLTVNEDGQDLLAQLKRECEANTSYLALSTTRLDHWPILLLACRRYRLPPPPQLWMELLSDLVATKEEVRLPQFSLDPLVYLKRQRMMVSETILAGARTLQDAPVAPSSEPEV